MSYVSTECWPDRPPTAKQYAYAWKISNELNVPLPKVLDITAFSVFIEHYKDPFGEAIQEKKKQIENAIFEERMKDAENFSKELIG